MPRISTKDCEIIKTIEKHEKGEGLARCEITHNPSGARAVALFPIAQRVLDNVAEGENNLSINVAKEGAEAYAISKLTKTAEYKEWWQSEKKRLNISEKKEKFIETHTVHGTFKIGGVVQETVIPYKELLSITGFKSKIGLSPTKTTALAAFKEYLQGTKIITFTAATGKKSVTYYKNATNVAVSLVPIPR